WDPPSSGSRFAVLESSSRRRYGVVLSNGTASERKQTSKHCCCAARSAQLPTLGLRRSYPLVISRSRFTASPNAQHRKARRNNQLLIATAILPSAFSSQYRTIVNENVRVACQS